MLTAIKSRWFERVFAIYNRNLLRRRFDSFYVSGLPNLEKERPFPLIIYANHSSWWDGLGAFQLAKTVNLDSFVMMEEKHLRRFFLFRRLGAFSVVRENPRLAFQSVEYAAELLNEDKKRALWIFPQGKIFPNNQRPIVFFNGVSKIIEKVARVFVLPLAFRYEFSDKFKPDIFVKIGELEFVEVNDDFTRKAVIKILSENLTSLLDQLNTDILSKKLENYQNII